jgi:serine/arginine repetitive matrix protein 2
VPVLPQSFSKPSTPGKQSKAKAPTPAKSSAFKSRFADSSDEDDDRPARFTSRFDDSDSEPEPYELPPDLAPVRGIPRKAGEEDGDSTDLEEEVEMPRPQSSAVANIGITNGHSNGVTNGEGTALSAGSLRDSKHAPPSPATKTKRGFFGMGKKKAVATPAPAITQTAQAPEPASPVSDIPLPPQPRNREVGDPLTPIGEDDDKELGSSPLALAASPQVKESPRSLKLQRRSTPEWPLAPHPPITGEQRPMSSDGVARRPRFGKRQSSQLSTVTSPVLDAQGRSVSFGRNGKKKKFQGLRRVFGIND